MLKRYFYAKNRGVKGASLAKRKRRTCVNKKPASAVAETGSWWRCRSLIACGDLLIKKPATTVAEAGSNGDAGRLKRVAISFALWRCRSLRACGDLLSILRRKTRYAIGAI